jgi:dolichol-phosphate mannosyltransferase
MNAPSLTVRDVAVVCPTYQEGSAIATFLERMLVASSTFRTVRLTELIFVDDGSTDGTVEQVREAERTWTSPKVFLIQRTRKDGTVSAQIAGFQRASAPIVVTMDADGQHPADTIERLGAAWSPEVDVVVASRNVAGGGVEWDQSGRRHTSEGARVLARLLLPPARGLSDPISGFFLARREWVAALPLPPHCYKLLLYLLAAHPEARVREIPYQMRPRVAGVSKVVGTGLGYRRRFVSELWRYRKCWGSVRRRTTGTT